MTLMLTSRYDDINNYDEIEDAFVDGWYYYNDNDDCIEDDYDVKNDKYDYHNHLDDDTLNWW